MLRSRITPCLLVHKKGLVKTVGFKDPKYVGDPINAVKIFNEKKSVVRCSALRETAVVYPDGKVACCELRNESIGNLRDFNMNLKDIWKNTAARNFRNSIKENKCYCWHQCFLSASIIKSPEMWLSLFKTFVKLS